MPCMCGADDCHACHPENFRGTGRSRFYIGDMSEEEAEIAMEAAASADEARAEAFQDAREAREHGGA